MSNLLRAVKVLVLAVCLTGCVPGQQTAAPSNPQTQSQPLTRHDITGDQLQAMIGDGSPLVLLDVRTPEEYAIGHIPGTLNRPLSEIDTWAASLDSTARTVTICQAGGRSQTAANTLVGRGFASVYNLLGGMDAWAGEVTTEAFAYVFR